MAIPALDHLILFLPVSPDKTPVIPQSLSQNFTLTPGGTHADGLTANTLILLADGCYIELICFLPQDDPSKITNHWWGPDPKFTGWRDWCLTTTSTSADDNWERVKESHGKPIEGGRKRPDGELVKWSVTFPTKLGGQEVRGSVPFFCHDRTPRDLRVPLSRPGATSHPSSVLGVKSLTVIVKTQESLDKFRKIYQIVLGVEGILRENEIYFDITRVVNAEGLDQGPNIILRLPKSEEERKKVENTGREFWYGDVVLAAPAGETGEVGKTLRIDGDEDDLMGFWVEYV